ncbi:MAG: hypothetical protein J6B52_03340 [Clostridia bacterium]|nr:hypothetical protein [Clostridia bacterium]
MPNFIEEFYYGNIEPQEITTELKPELRKRLKALSQTESVLAASLTDAESELFDTYLKQSGEFLCVSNADSFIAGFKLGAKFTYNTFVD